MITFIADQKKLNPWPLVGKTKKQPSLFLRTVRGFMKWLQQVPLTVSSRKED